MFRRLRPAWAMRDRSAPGGGQGCAGGLPKSDGHSVAVARVPELDPRHKPCYVRAKGENAGRCVRRGGASDSFSTQLGGGLSTA